MASVWAFRNGGGVNGGAAGPGLSSASTPWPNLPSFSNSLSIGRAGKNLFRVKRQPDRTENGNEDGDSTSTSSSVSWSSTRNNPGGRVPPAASNHFNNNGGIAPGIQRAATHSSPLLHVPAGPLKMLQTVFCGLASVIGMGVFVIIGHVANEVAGPAIISSLIIAAVASLLSGLCYAEFQTRQSLMGDTVYSCCYQIIGEFPAFVVGWSLVLQNVSGMAATGRALSALLDYITSHALQTFWLQRLGRVPLFDTHPDLVAFLFVILMALPFGLGLRWPRRLNFVLSGVALAVAVLFVTVGAQHVDSHGWSAHGFLPYESSGLLSGAAICTFAFSGHYAMMAKMRSVKRPERCVPLVTGGTLTLCFITYFAVATVLTLMVHHKKLDSEVPLLMQAFEIHGVTWTRFVIGAGEGLCLVLTLLHLSHSMYLSVMALAIDGLVFRCLARRCPTTKSSLLTALLFGGIAALSAVVFPMTSLLEVMALPPLIINTLVCSCVLHQRYQPNDPYRYEPLVMETGSDPGTSTSPTPPTSPAEDRAQKPEALSSESPKSSRLDIRINKQDMFPLVKQNSLTTRTSDSLDSEEDDEDDDSRNALTGAQEVPLLELPCSPLLDSDGDVLESDYDDDSSDTDIDAIVEEYKEKIRVATLTGPGLRLGPGSSFQSGANQMRHPTAATGRRVCISVVGLSVTFFLVSLTLVLGNEALARAAPSSVVLLCVLLTVVISFLVVILRQPQNLTTQSSPRRQGRFIKVFRVPLLPWIPAIAAFLNVCLIANVLRKQWAPFAVWVIAGILMYFFYGIWNSTAANQSSRPQTAEKIKLQPLPRQLFLSSVLPIHNQTVDSTRRITQVDTILIAR